MKSNKLKIRIIGCGAIVEESYLPALKNISDLTLTSIIDTNPRIIADISKRYKLDYIGSDIDQGLKFVDAFIVATPNYLHVPISIKCMEAGLDGWCNPIYIDDLIQGLLHCAEKKEAVGQTFILSGENVITWNDYFQTYNELGGLPEIKVSNKANII